MLALAAILGAWPKAQAAPEDIAKYADPGVQVAQLMEGGGAVIVSSLNILANGDLITIAFVSRDQAASVGVTVAGKWAVIGRISKDQGRSWGPAFRVVDSPADGSRTAVDPTTVVAGGKILVIAPMSGPPKPPFDYGDLKLWKVESADHGATWSQPAEIPIPRARPCVSGRPGITLGDGTILVPYWWDFMFQTGANGMAVIGDIPCVSGTLISQDGGATWQLSTDVYGEWSAQAAGFFVQLWRAGLAEYDELEGIAWEWSSIDGALCKAPLAKECGGSNPADRGKKWTQTQRAHRRAWRPALDYRQRGQGA